MQILNKLIAQIEKLSITFGYLSAIALILMVMIESVVVFLRYGLNFGSIYLQESIIYLHAFAFLLAAAFGLMQNNHVRVDMFYRNFSVITKAWVNLLGSLLFLLPFTACIFFLSFGYVKQSWLIMEVSADSDGIPAVYILKSFIPLFSFLLFLQAIAELLKNCQKILASRHQQVN